MPQFNQNANRNPFASACDLENAVVYTLSVFLNAYIISRSRKIKNTISSASILGTIHAGRIVQIVISWLNCNVKFLIKKI